MALEQSRVNFRKIVMIRINDTERCRDARVKHAKPFLLHDFKQACRFLIGHDELDRYDKLSGQLEKPVFMHGVVPAEATDGTKRRTATQPHPVGRFEQPLPEQHALTGLVFIDVKSEDIAFHDQPPQQNRIKPNKPI